MTTRKLALGAALALAAGGIMIASASGASAATTPPWEPDGSSVGGLLFYNSAGTQITGGNISTEPIAAYVQGTTAVRSGDTKATLYGYLPKNGVAPGGWSGELLGGPTTYPLATAPSALASSALPLEAGAAGDVGVADLASDLPNTATDAYAGLYQLRLKTTQANQPANTTYDSADILITGSTWSVVYPASTVTSTTTTLTTSPASPQIAGTSIQLTATVSPATDGTVQFEDGSTPIGSPVTVASGAASLSISTLSVGSHTLNAVFTPSGSTFSGSTGTTSFTVSPAAATSTNTALGVDPTTAAADTPVNLTASVTSGGIALASGSGTVKFYDNATTLLGSSAVGAGGVATLTYGAFSEGSHSLSAQFVPTNSAVYATSTSAPITFTATAPVHAPAPQTVTTTIPAGSLVITTPYSSSNPFALGTAVLNPGQNEFVATAHFGAESNSATGNDGGVTITDTRSGNLPWTASVTVTDFTDGATPTPDTINGENLSFTGVTAVQIQGNSLLASAVNTTNVTSAAISGTPYGPTDPGNDGLKNGPHPFATAAHGFGEIDVDGVLTLDAPTSTVAGTYTATLTFTVV
jgi:hypothetical protein